MDLTASAEVALLMGLVYDPLRVGQATEILFLYFIYYFNLLYV